MDSLKKENSKDEIECGNESSVLNNVIYFFKP